MTSDNPNNPRRSANEIEALIVPHGPHGECPDPELCMGLTELREAQQRETMEDSGRENLTVAVKLLRRLVDHETEPCRLDHDGNCQQHFVDNPCTVADTRNFLAQLESSNGNKKKAHS